MKNSTIYLLITGVLLILFSPALGDIFIDIVYSGGNLTGEYVPLLSGSITAFLWLGIIAVATVLVPLFIAKSK